MERDVPLHELLSPALRVGAVFKNLFERVEVFAGAANCGNSGDFNFQTPTDFKDLPMIQLAFFQEKRERLRNGVDGRSRNGGSVSLTHLNQSARGKRPNRFAN